jgi:hypothetical protein
MVRKVVSWLFLFFLLSILLFPSLVDGWVPGFLPLLVTGVIGFLLSAWLGNWKQRRHDYGSLLEEMSKSGKIEEVPRRIELASLVASEPVLKILEKMRKEASENDWKWTFEKSETWRTPLLDAMRRDLKPLVFL